MPRLYVDLDNNRLVTGPQSTVLASTPRLVQGDKPVLDLELYQRTNNVLGYYASTASAINVRVGTLGGTAVATALTFSSVTLSITATATAGLATPVTATGTASLLGSVTATASAGVNNPTVITITPTVTTWSSALATAYLGPEAIPPVVKYSLTPAYDKYLDVVEAGTPYDSATEIKATAASGFSPYINRMDLTVYKYDPFTTVTFSDPSVQHVFLRRWSTIEQSTYEGSGFIEPQIVYINNTPTTVATIPQTLRGDYLNTSGQWVNGSTIPSISAIDLKNFPAVSNTFGYETLIFSTYHYNTLAQVAVSYGGGGTTAQGYAYQLVYVRSNSSNPNEPTVPSGTLNFYNSNNNLLFTTTRGIFVEPPMVTSMLNGKGNNATYVQYDNNVTNELKTAVSFINNTTITGSAIDRISSFNQRRTFISNATGGAAGSDVSLVYETTYDSKKQITGGAISVANEQYDPNLAKPKTGIVTIYPERAYLGKRVDRIEVTACGAQYESVPTVLISEPENENGITAKASASLVGGKLSEIIITHPGSGYTLPPDVFVMPPEENMKSGSARSVSSIVTLIDRKLVLSLASGTTISDNSWCILSGLGRADGLAYVVSVASGGSETTIKFPYNLGTILPPTSASLTPLIPYVRVSGATISGTDTSFAPGSTIPVSFSSPSCSDTDAVANFTVLNSGALALASIPTPGFANSFSVSTLAAYKKLNGITVTCAGAGYWDVTPTITVDNGAFVPTAPGAVQAVVTATLNGTGGVILSVVSAGYGYTSAPTITITAPNSGNGVRRVTLATSGVGYSDGTFACTVATAPSGGATAVVNFVKSGSSQGFVVADPGRGYTSVPVITAPAPDLGGQISGFTITSAGAGYGDTAPLITITGGGGSGALATAILTNGTVSSIILDAAGAGYTSTPSVVISDPPASVYYSKQIDLSGASVTTLLGGNSSASATLQIEEKRNGDTTVLAQIPVTILARVS